MTNYNKTIPSKYSVNDYLQSIKNESQRNDAIKLNLIMEQETGVKPKMWGTSIIGFGTYHYKYETGREGDTVSVGFSARKKALTIYGLFLYQENKKNIDLAKKLGAHTHGKGCLYIKSLKDIDISILRKMIKVAYFSRQNS